MPTPGSLQLVTVTAGVPTAGSGTASTLDNVFDATNGPVAVKAASTAAVATDKAMVVAISPNGQNPNGQTTASGSVPVVMASNPLSAATNGLTSSRVNSAATTNATSLKAGSANLGRIDLFNMAAYDIFFKFYNKSSAPTVGTDVPVWTIPIKAGTGFSTELARGKSLSTGIAYAITKNQVDTDTTAVAVGDCTGSIDWI